MAREIMGVPMRGGIQDGGVGPSGRGGPASLAELKARVNDAQATVKELTDKVRETRLRLSADNLKRCARQRDVRSPDIVEEDICRARVLKGHTRKVYAIDWCQSDPNKLVSASQDGWLVVWNAYSAMKLFSIKQYNPWVMTCAYAPAGNLVARGGLDNLCAIYSLSQSRMDKEGNLPPVRMLSGHKGYVACCKFVEDSQILSASGDKTCILWDVPGNRRLHIFGGDGGSGTGHTADVMSISVSPSNSHIFVSGSCDNTAKLWDMRTPGTAQITFHAHAQDVNAVQFHADGLTFGTGSDDGTCALFDRRSAHELARYGDDEVGSSSRRRRPMHIVTSIAFSHSGRILFAGYSNHKCKAYDTLSGEQLFDLPHDGQVSAVAMCPDGTALATASWDQQVRIWAPFQQKKQSMGNSHRR